MFVLTFDELLTNPGPSSNDEVNPEVSCAACVTESLSPLVLQSPNMNKQAVKCGAVGELKDSKM